MKINELHLNEAELNRTLEDAAIREKMSVREFLAGGVSIRVNNSFMVGGKVLSH